MSRSRSMHRPGRLMVAVAALVVIVVLAPARVAAHGGDADAASSNYRSTITDPGTEGLVWTSRGGDGLLELTNETGREVVVLGYQAEPYLWFVPGEGVYRNDLSPARYLNEDRFGDVDMPPGTSASSPPDWVLVTTDDRYAWHDHRAHWMARSDPPVVAADPGRRHVVLDFEIPMRVGADDAVAATGRLHWFPDVAWWPPIVALALGGTALVAAVAVVTRPTERRWAPLARVAAVLVLLVVAANVARVIDDLSRSPSPTERNLAIITAVVTLAAIVVLCARAWRGHPGGFGALAVAALMVMLLYGGEAAGELSAPYLDTSLPEWFRRWTIGASYAVLAPVFVAVVIAAWWHARTVRPLAGAVSTEEPDHRDETLAGDRPPSGDEPVAARST